MWCLVGASPRFSFPRSAPIPRRGEDWLRAAHAHPSLRIHSSHWEPLSHLRLTHAGGVWWQPSPLASRQDNRLMQLMLQSALHGVRLRAGDQQSAFPGTVLVLALRMLESPSVADELGWSIPLELTIRSLARPVLLPHLSPEHRLDEVPARESPPRALHVENPT